MLSFLLFSFFQTAAFSPEKYERHDLERIYSPTGLITVGRSLLLSADLREPRPGVYRLNHTKQGYVPSLIHQIPAEDITGLTLDPSGNLLVFSQRKMSITPSDWGSRAILYTFPHFRTLGKYKLPIKDSCPGSALPCGVRGGLFLKENLLLAISGDTFGYLHLLQRKGETWQLVKERQLRLARRPLSAVDIKRYQGKLLLLLRKQWRIVHLMDDLDGPQPLTTFFDFSHLKNTFRTSSAQVNSDGLAESFVIDDRGRMFLLLNNKGADYTSKDELKPGPKLLVFSQKK